MAASGRIQPHPRMPESSVSFFFLQTMVNQYRFADSYPETEDDEENFISGIREDVVSSSSSYIGNEADAIGEVDVPMNEDWFNPSMDGMNGFVGI